MGVLIMAHHDDQIHHLFFPSPAYPVFIPSRILHALQPPWRQPHAAQSPAHPPPWLARDPLLTALGTTAIGKGQGGEAPIKIFSHLHGAAQQGQES